MQTRAIPFAIITASVTAIAVTALPWMSFRKVGIDISWNGLGIASVPDIDLAPHGRGWLIVAACVFAGLTALVALLPSPTARPIARTMAGAAAVFTGAATLVPIAIWIWPSWYFGTSKDHLGLPDGDPITVSIPILVTLIVTLALLTALCVGLFAERTASGSAQPHPPIRTRSARTPQPRR